MLKQYLDSFKKKANSPFLKAPDQIAISFLLISLILMIVIIRKAWSGDDAYITFRVIDNFVNGFGLRFNVLERVQAYTHPLWLLLLTPFYLLWGKIELVSAGVSILLTMFTQVTLALIARKNNWTLVAAGAILLFSRAFTDFSISGLENPLAHCLLAIFIYLYLNDRETNKNVVQISFAAAMVMLTRIDLGLIVFPGLIWLFLEKPSGRRFALILIGLSPVFLWEIFSLLYYGFPFPNTAYAKLNAGVPVGDYLTRGLLYYIQLLSFDPVTFLVLVAGSIGGFLISTVARQKILFLGCLLYLGYIFWIGGDFMMGRFFSAPLVAIVVILLFFETKMSPLTAFAVCTVSFAMGTYLPATPVYSIGNDEGTTIVPYLAGISDARKEYMANNLAIAFRPGENETRHPWKDAGLEDRKIFSETGEIQVIQAGPIGMRGFYAGHSVHLIDTYALADPLLARLPSEIRSGWRPGHLIRSIPVGYPETISSGKNQIADEQLHIYYDRLKEIINDPIFDSRRLISVVKMNLGLYDYLIDKDRYRYSGVEHIRLACENGECESFLDTNLQFYDSGLDIRLDKPIPIFNISLVLSIRLISLRILTFNVDNQLLDERVIIGPGKFDYYPNNEKSDVPVSRIRILPESGSGSYYLTDLKINSIR
jgi:arabinofuranosyltransferase